MTQDLLVTIGEEYLLTNVVDNDTLRIGLYNDTLDAIEEGSNYADINNEPGNSNYSTVDVKFSATNIDGNWGVNNDDMVEFDFSDIQDDSVEVDTAFVLAQFDSTEAGTDDWHLIANPSLSQTRKVGSIDTLEVGAGEFQLKLE